MKNVLSMILALLFAITPAPNEPAETTKVNTETKTVNTEDYTLEQVVVLSRHNLRAPLSSNGSIPEELTPHSWIDWSAGSSELTLKGSIEETSMGGYFRKWLDAEGLIKENSIPEEGEVRFYARDKQRCRATARYFASGMLPLTDVVIEHPGDPYNTEDFMNSSLKFYSDSYAVDAYAQVAAMGGKDGIKGFDDKVRDTVKLVMDTVDMQDSEIYQSGKYGDLLTDSSEFVLASGAEPDFTGTIKTASQVVDALILQYYEEPDSVKAAFGHELTDEDWQSIGGLMTTYQSIKYGNQFIAANVTHPLLIELEKELKNEDRKFSMFCAHDVTVLGTLAALGAEPYCLPESIETLTPIDVKLLFERWRDSKGKVWYRVDLVYRSVDQIRNADVLTLDAPPLRYDIEFKGIKKNKDGLISEADLFKLFDDSIVIYDEITEKYGEEEIKAAA